MSPIVRLHLHGGSYSPDDLHCLAHPAVDVDLDRLTPRARALAEAWANSDMGCRGLVLLESARTIREMDPGASPAWFTQEQMDQPHSLAYDSWSAYPPASAVDPHDYLEQQIARMPIGYYVTGRDAVHRVPSADAARGDAEHLTKPQVMELLRDLGRPISPTTMDNYRSRPPADWPQPVTYVGRTPLWRRSAIEAYAQRHLPS